MVIGSGLVGVHILYVYFHSGNAFREVAQALLYYVTYMLSKGFGAFDVLIGVDLYLHVLKVRIKPFRTLGLVTRNDKHFKGLAIPPFLSY